MVVCVPGRPSLSSREKNGACLKVLLLVGRGMVFYEVLPEYVSECMICIYE